MAMGQPYRINAILPQTDDLHADAAIECEKQANACTNC